MKAAPAYIALPPPISVNNLFLNLAGRGRRTSKEYTAWKASADEWLAVQGPLPKLTCRASVALFVGADGVGQMDIDNTAKAYIDTLVRHGITVDDKRKYLASVRVAWVDGMRGCIAEIAAEREVPALRGFHAALSRAGRDLILFDFARDAA